MIVIDPHPKYVAKNPFIKLLLWIGFVAIGRKSNICDFIGDGKGTCKYRYPKSVQWPFSAPPWWQIKLLLRGKAVMGWKPYVFRNLKGVIKWQEGRLLPRRWGVGWIGFEFGDRGH